MNKVAKVGLGAAGIAAIWYISYLSHDKNIGYMNSNTESGNFLENQSVLKQIEEKKNFVREYIPQDSFQKLNDQIIKEHYLSNEIETWENIADKIRAQNTKDSIIKQDSINIKEALKKVLSQSPEELRTNINKAIDSALKNTRIKR